MAAMKNLGDKIATISQPIARGIDKVFGTNLKECDGCKRMQEKLNQGMTFADAFYDRFWPSKEKEID
jgi:hypothetical protein